LNVVPAYVTLREVPLGIVVCRDYHVGLPLRYDLAGHVTHVSLKGLVRVPFRIHIEDLQVYVFSR
jgi:hypothetical protein